MHDMAAEARKRGVSAGREQSRGRRRAEKLAESGPRLVVATYNVHTCVGVDRRYDPARVAAVLRELKADIIGLQEVGAKRIGQRAAEQWRVLAEATGLNAITGLGPDHNGRGCGNAVLTRFPVEAVRRIDLSVPGHGPRGALAVTLLVEDRRLRVIAAHLGLSAAERRAQIARLLELIAEPDASGDAVLMMGDLNEWRGRRGAIAALDRTLGRAPAPRTFPSWCPILRLDRIYAGTPVVLRGLQVHRSGLARLASDHLPLRATLSWS
jgi:endonuclease/exonuclease/phosphatase family metal-dependent hydrolase